MRLFAGAWRVGKRMEHILTSEAVTRGHPDKVCDQIADALLDAVLAEDPEARAACEAAVWENRVWLFGELTAQQEPDYEAVVREVLRDIGYDRPELGLDAETCDIEVHFHPQSPDIARGVSHRAAEDTGAGDQGIMAGYACRETAERMPLPITLANRLAKRLEAVRQEGILPWLRPDGKAQVSVAYRDGVPVGITTVVLSAQHDPDITVDDLREALRQEVVLPVLSAELVREDTLLYINPTGRFVTGGPAADSGLTGRKPLADTYGSAARYGGGSLSGKDQGGPHRSLLGPVSGQEHRGGRACGPLRGAAGLCHRPGGPRQRDGGHLRHRNRPGPGPGQMAGGKRGYAARGGEPPVRTDPAHLPAPGLLRLRRRECPGDALGADGPEISPAF